MNISMFLQMAAETFPERIAVSNPDGHYSYGQLYDAAQAAAGLMRESACRYVVVLDTSSAALPIALMGAAMAGLPYVPLNYRLTEPELQALMDRVKPALLIGSPDLLEKLGDQSDTRVLTREAFLAQTLESDDRSDEVAEDPDAVAVQLFTSGTTGAPKAAILRHENLVSYILGTVEFMSAEEEEATLVSVPPYHIAGISALMSSIYACRRIVQLPNFEAEAWLETCHREGVTNAFVVPTMLSRIIAHLDHHPGAMPPPSIRAIAYGGGKMPMPVVESALTHFPGVNFTNAYGLTETSSTIALLDPEDHRIAFASDDPVIRHRLASVGKALPSVEIEVRDDAGNVLGPNEHGEIYVRGPQVSGEYLERRAIGDDGWFPTRDAGYIDEHGYIHLGGRADDIIVRGGENISPSEIEDVLLDHPAIMDIAAVGIPSEEWGEAVGAVVVLKEGATADVGELQAMVRKALRSSRVPERILFVDELPYNETGKLLRRLVKRYFD
ncbi:MAG: class I adenylate-forming enzyme family protein [Pseudomonadales bacterium]